MEILGASHLQKKTLISFPKYQWKMKHPLLKHFQISKFIFNVFFKQLFTSFNFLTDLSHPCKLDLKFFPNLVPFSSSTAQKMKFSIKDFFNKCDQIPQFPVDLITFAVEIFNGKLHFLCSVA